MPMMGMAGALDTLSSQAWYWTIPVILLLLRTMLCIPMLYTALRSGPTPLEHVVADGGGDTYLWACLPTCSSLQLVRHKQPTPLRSLARL